MRTIVLGAGVAGVMTAHELAKRGHEVVVVERHEGAADETSFGNGGVLGHTQVEPWAQPGVPSHILKWLGREDAPLLLRLGQIPRMWRWGARFLANCSEERFHRNMESSLRLTRYSLACFAEVRAETGLAFDHRAAGALKVYLTQAGLDEFARAFERSRDYGMNFRVIDPAECARIEPALAPTVHTLKGGIHFPDDETGDCRKFTRALAGYIQGRGVKFMYGTTIEGLEVVGGRVEAVATSAGPLTADNYVAALASYTPRLLRTFGLDVPICPIKGVSVTVPVDGWTDAVRGAVIDHTRLFGLIRLGERLRISGSAEITGYDPAPARSRCEALIRSVLELFPAFRSSLAAGEPLMWAGLRGNTPDGPPILGRTPIANLFLNVGHGPQGWSTSHGSARLVADIASGRAPDIDMAGLTLDRF